MLGEVATSLRGPLSTVQALRRIGELDQEIGRLDRLAALGDLLTEIVHEVRNPLVSVKTFLQLLPDRLDDPDFHQDFRLVVSDELARLERLLDSVLRHGAPQDAGLRSDTTSVGESFETVSNLIGHRARERGVTLERPDDDTALQVGITADALRQVVLNLTLNALDATPSGGVVRLRAHAIAAADGRWVEIAVEDEGDGIPDDARAHIFEPFYSTRSQRPGGLGLAISKRLVEEAGGSIHVDSGSAGGARFAIRLAAARTP
jgi:signal transduction histidine kinase